MDIMRFFRFDILLELYFLCCTVFLLRNFKFSPDQSLFVTFSNLAMISRSIIFFVSISLLLGYCSRVNAPKFLLMFLPNSNKNCSLLYLAFIVALLFICVQYSESTVVVSAFYFRRCIVHFLF